MTKGPVPAIELFSLRAKTPNRHLTDLLPYLPDFRHLFAALPTEVAEMELKFLKVPISDIDCLTQTFVQVRGPIWYP